MPDLSQMAMPEDTPVNINPIPPEDNTPINIDEGSSSPVVTPETADNRSFKAHYGLADILQKSRDAIFADIQKGDENTLRQTAADVINDRRRQQTTQAISELAARKGSALSPDEEKGITDLIQHMNKDTDPASVFEEGFAKSLIAEMDNYATAHPESFINTAKQQDPEAVAKIQSYFSDIAAKRAYVNTMLENIDDEIKQQGYIGYGIDFAKSLIPGYTDYALRGNVPGVGELAGGTLGANLDEQRKTLFNLPFDEFKQKLNESARYLRDNNPQMARDFVQSMLGQSTSESGLKSAQIAIDLAGTGAATAVGKAGKAALKSAGILKDTAKAAADIAAVAGEKNVSRSVIAEAAGDLHEAAVAKATTNLTAEINGASRATAQAVEALSSTFRTDLEDFKAGATGASKELVNRVEENSNTLVRNIITTAGNINKVERIPEVLSNETAVRAIIEDTKDLYPTLRNAVLDVSKPYKEPISTNVLVDMKLGKNDGTYFSTRSVAENYIKFHRLNDAVIEEGTDVTKKPNMYYLPEKSVKTVSGQVNPNFGYEITKEGKPTFFSDIVNRVEVVPSPIAKQGFIPVEVEGQKATFGKPIATVEQQGLGYYVKLTVPVPENSSVMRDAIAETGHTKLPDSPARTFMTNMLGKYRSPEEVLSKAERQNRLAVTYSPSQIISILKNNIQEIEKLSAGRFSSKPKKQRWEDWQRMVEYANTKIDPESSKPGYFYKSPTDMATDWVQVLGRLPDDQEIAAYFQFKQNMEVDRMFRNIAAHRNQQRVGAMTNRLVVTGADGKEIKSAEFSGVAKREFPGGDGNILVLGTKEGEEKLYRLGKINSKLVEDFKDKVLRGEQRVIEIYAPEQRPLNGYLGLTDERVQYVMAPTIETRSLDWNQIPRRGGGHLQYDYDHYVKQAKIHHDKVGNRFWYEGDTTVFPIQYESMGKEVAKHLDQVRKYLQDKNESAAEAYSKQYLPIDWNEVRGWFLGNKDGEKFSPPSLNLREPIQVVGRGETIMGKDKGLERRYAGQFKDGTRQNSLARQQQIEFSGERDSHGLMTIEDRGTQGNPLWKAMPAKTVDPVTSMQRGLMRIIKSNFYDDYKTSSVEHWLKQASPYLAATDNEIKYSPFYFYNEAKFKPDAPADVIQRLKVAKYHIDQIVGMPSETDNLLYQYSQKVSDYVYQKLGPKAPVIVPGWVLPKLQDPFAFVRSIVFHAKLGLFNVPQFIVQAGNYSNILGVAGYKYAAPGTFAAQLHFWSTVNSHPNILNRLDDLATKMILPGSSKWKPGEFKEAFQELQKTGFGVAGREHVLLDDPTSTKMFTNGVDNFLDWGTSFFRGGEQNARYGAWYTAYKEFRDKNPFGRITDADRANILQRADLLNVNMSRASSSAMNKGIWSIPMQFYSYQQRLLSLFFSNRITMKERARLLAWNAALYGIPMSIGTTGLPVVDYFRKTAIDNGYVVGDSFIKSMLMEGVPSALGAMATGKGDPSAGTWYDVGQRFGTKGLEFLGNAGTPDKSYLDIAGGAAYSVLKSTVQATDGLRRVILSMANRDGDAFPVTAEDFIDPLKQITSVSSTMKILAATNFGRWVSNNEAYLADTSPTQAIITGLLGIKDTNIDDMQVKNNALKDMAQYQKQIEKDFQKDFRRGMLANRDGNYEEGKKYLTRAQTWLHLGQFRDDQINAVMGRALNENQSILDKIDMDYYIKKAPPGTQQDRLDAYQRSLQIKEKKQ